MVATTRIRLLTCHGNKIKKQELLESDPYRYKRRRLRGNKTSNPEKREWHKPPQDKQHKEISATTRRKKEEKKTKQTYKKRTRTPHRKLVETSYVFIVNRCEVNHYNL